MSRWNERRDAQRGDVYDSRWEKLEAAGQAIHGEADLIESVLADRRESSDSPLAVLDAGCGTGRVGIELAKRGFDVVGVDLDPSMLATARDKAPHIEWHIGDLSAITLQQEFDLIALPGNVMIFLAPRTEPQVLSNLASHLRPDGLLVAGFQLGPEHLSLADYDTHAAAAGLAPVDRWSTWGRDCYIDGDYAVSLHQRHGTLA